MVSDMFLQMVMDLVNMVSAVMVECSSGLAMTLETAMMAFGSCLNGILSFWFLQLFF